MNISPDYVIERKQHRSQIRNWKVIALLMFIVLMIVINVKKMPFADTGSVLNEDSIGAIYIDGIIFEDKTRDEKLEAIAADGKVKALIMHINSPGGTVVGAEKLYNYLRKIAEEKPVVAVLGTMATSGGYLTALGSDYIISHNGTITGSIGVILQSAEVTELAEKIGVRFNSFKSGELKATPNPMEKVTPEVKEAIMSTITDTYDYFVSVVAQRRNLPLVEVKKIADGRIYSGRQALGLKLVDAIGSTDDALKWLKEVKGIKSDLKVQEISLKTKPKFIDIVLDNVDNLMPNFLKNRLQGVKAIMP